MTQETKQNSIADIMSELNAAYENDQKMELGKIEVKFSKDDIERLQSASSEELERETIKMILNIYQNAMNTANYFIDLIKRGDAKDKTKEAVSQCFREANSAMNNLNNIIKSKKSIDMNKIVEDEPLEKDDTIRVGIESFHKIIEKIDLESEKG